MKTLIALIAVATGVSACGGVLLPVTANKAEALSPQRINPRVVWVLDRSGSMHDVLANGATRLDVVRTWLATLGPQLKPTSRNGLVLYPADSDCGGPSAFAVPVPAEGAPDSFPSVLASVNAVIAGGGTPTSAALRFVAATLPDEPLGETFVVLLTDGLPNCNGQNPNTCDSPAACRCTVGAAGNACGSVGSLMCTAGCLDDLGMLAAGQELTKKGHQLMVVGLGPEAASGAALLSTLDQPLGRDCKADADCRAGTACDVARGECAERLYTVQSSADLELPGARLNRAVTASSRCTFWFDQSLDGGALTVRLGSDALLAGTDGYAVRSSRSVMVQGAACDRLQADPSLAPQFTWRSAH